MEKRNSSRIIWDARGNHGDNSETSVSLGGDLMDKFRDELKKQILYCCSMNNFRATVYISSKNKIKYVRNVLNEIIDNVTYMKYEKLRCVFSQYENFIIFSNGSRLKVIVPTESSKGNKTNGCLIDIDIFDNTKRTIIYPQLFPRTTSEKNDNFESWDEVKKRVVEVEIKEEQ